MLQISPHHTSTVVVEGNKKNIRLQLENAYGLFSISVLLLTTVAWSLLAAHIHQQNADQLIDPYLFTHPTTFHDATFPSQHSFLLKWPIFLLVALFGSSPAVFISVTVLICLLTVGMFASILYRIERRPLIFGTLCLALASVLLLTSAEPYPGALLPLNMGMISTRNIEYVMYIIGLILIIRADRIFSWKSGLATLVLGILIASDKLFLTVSLGGALASVTVYFISKRSDYTHLAFRWLILSITSATLAFGILQIITVLHLTSFSHESSLSPYAFIHTFKELIIGSVYAALGVLTNLGANPAFDATMIKSLPSSAFHRLISIEGVAYLANSAIAIISMIILFRFLHASVRSPMQLKEGKKRHPRTVDLPLHLSILLIWSTLASIIVFIISNHYYAVDARYLALVTFTLFIILATFLRRTKLPTPLIMSVGAVLACSIAAGSIAAWQSHSRSITALSTVGQQNDLVTSALRQHTVTTLLGDYWRVTPIKLKMERPQNILPLGSCTTPRSALVSRAWEKDVKKQSFAYLLTFAQSKTGYPGCTIEQVIAAYGRPSGSQVISGTANNPKEILLFYDYGANVYKHHQGTVSNSILPRSINQIADKPCDGVTVMNIIPHQDDDILFMNPDLIHHIKEGACIRSVYLTAGDSGSNKLYWIGREEGSKAAYAAMFGLKNPKWITRSVSISESKLITITSLKDDPRIVLVFMHLPDGNVSGTGFPATHLESLAKLRSGVIPLIHTVDGQTTYTSAELISTLSILMEAYHSTEIQTMATINFSSRYPDHSDHLNTGAYTRQAYDQYTQRNPTPLLKFYIGYPIRERPENVTGQDLQDTKAAFFTYAQYDQAACNSVTTCKKMSYAYYLNRQYHTQP